MATENNNTKLAERYADFVLRYRNVIFIALIVSTVLGALQIHKLDIRNDPDTLLPPSNRYVATNLYAEHNFGMGNLMVFASRSKRGMTSGSLGLSTRYRRFIASWRRCLIHARPTLSISPPKRSNTWGLMRAVLYLSV